jgi:hypothetical protein
VHTLAMKDTHQTSSNEICWKVCRRLRPLNSHATRSGSLDGQTHLWHFEREDSVDNCRDENQPISPDEPSGSYSFDLMGFQSLIITIVPLVDIFCENMVRCLREVSSQEVECFMGTVTGRNKNGAQVDHVNEFWGKGNEKEREMV